MAEGREPSDPPPEPDGGGPATPGELNEMLVLADDASFASSWDGLQSKRMAVLFTSRDEPVSSLLKAVRFLQADVEIVPAELRQKFADTAFWSPSVRTGEDGRATVDVDLPDNLTEWRVTARGSSQGPLVGEGRTSFKTVKRILVRPDAPRFLTQGDTTTATASVHSSLETETDLTVRFGPENLRATSDAEKRDKIGPGAVKEYEIVLVGDAHGLAKVRVEALTPVESDAAVEALPVIPYGLRRVDGGSGVLVEEAFVKLVLPEGALDGTTSATVTLSPSIDVALLESLAYTSSYPWGCVEQTVNRFLPALAARNALTKAGSARERLKKIVDGTVERGIAALISMQNDDGSFGWFGRRTALIDVRSASGDAEMTAYAVLGLVRAEQAGFQVSRPNRDRAVEAAVNLVRSARAEDRVFLLYALSYAGRAELDALNAVFRERSTLSPRALALLALTMQRTGRPSNALEAARMLASSAVREGGTANWGSEGMRSRAQHHAWPARDAEPTAYALLALLSADPTSPLIDEAAAWLAASRRGAAWRSTRDTAVAIEALAEHAKSRGVERAQCEVDVFVNDGEKPAATVTFGGPGQSGTDAPSTVEIPAASLKAGENRVVLRRRGQGRVHWSALLAAVVRPAEGKTIEAGGRLMSVSRDYTAWFRPPLPGEAPEQRIAPGYEVVVPEKRPAGWHGRPLALAGTGDKIRVTLRVRSPERVERVIVEDSLPAGFEVVTGSAEGPFDREERRDDRQVFFFASLEGETTVSYVLQAVHPGEYRALPTLARPMYEPEIHAWSRENRLTVRPEPGLAGRLPSAEEITPDEVWGLALRAFSVKDWTRARAGFEELMAKYELRPDVMEECYARLFAIGVEIDDAPLLVKSCEQLVDRNPRRAPSGLRERRKLAAAYQSLGEHERALALLRDVLRELSAADDEAAAAFHEIGNPWRALALADAAALRRPDAGWAEAQELAVARAYATTRALAAPADAKHRVPRTSDAMPFLLNESVRRLRAFQAHHATSSLADEAGYVAVQTLLQMKLPADVIAEGTKFVPRYPKSRWLDDVTFLVAEGHFQAGDYDKALAAAKPLYERKFPTDGDPRREDWSPFRSNAVHLTAKVAHLRGDLARAVDLYRQVENLFPDARDAREFLTREGLELRDVERAAVGQTPVLHMRRKDLAEVRLKVYAVDFMILYALRRDLSAVNRIDLAGVEPVKEWVVARQGPEDFRWHDEEVPLPAKEKGVYLVVAKGGGLDASSVVLVSDLDVSVQETGGRVRVYATNRTTGAPAGDVYVKIGAGSTIQAQGFTDPRGVFEAGAVSGAFSVVAEKDGNVALWRK
jgi:tetratricopeptide (TPR) repeat protein